MSNSSQKLFVSWDGDAIGREIGQARLRDDVEEIRRINQAIDAGNLAFKAWALAAGGSVIEIGGDEGLLEIAPVALNDLESVRNAYKTAVGATVSVGVGRKMSDSSKALCVAKLRGRDRVVFWDDSCQKELDKASENPLTEEGKIHDEYLGKASDLDSQGPNSESNGGPPKKSLGVIRPRHQVQNRGIEEGKEAEKLAGHTVRSPESKVKAKLAEQSKAFDAKLKGPVEDSDQDLASVSPDFEGQFRGLADTSEQQDRVKKTKNSDEMGKLKQQIASALELVRKQLPVITELKAAYPDTYKSILALVQSVIALGKGLQEGEEALSKAEGTRKRNWVGAGLSIPPTGTPQRTKWESGFKNGLASYFAGGDTEALKPITAKLGDLDLPHVVDPNNGRGRLYTRMALGDRVPPILVHRQENGKLAVLDGNHRIAAAKLAGLSEIPAYERVTRGLAKDIAPATEQGFNYDLGLYKAGLAETMRPEDFDPDQLAIGTQCEMSEHGLDFEMARQIAMDHLASDPEHYDKDREKKTWGDCVTMEKEEVLPNQKFPGAKVLDKDLVEKTSLENKLPVGTLKDAKLKVRHGDGGTGWLGVKEGLIQGQDPSGHAVSSARPNAR